MRDTSRVMLEKVLPVKRMTAANDRIPRGFLLITGWDSHSSVCPLWQVRTTDSMLPVVFLFWSMITPPHFGHFFSKLFKQEPNTRNVFSLSGEPSSNSCSDDTISSLVIANGDLNLHHHRYHHHHHVYPFYHRRGRLALVVRGLYQTC